MASDPQYLKGWARVPGQLLDWRGGAIAKLDKAQGPILESPLTAEAFLNLST